LARRPVRSNKLRDLENLARIIPSRALTYVPPGMSRPFVFDAASSKGPAAWIGAG
jgi:hypothetical protein